MKNLILSLFATMLFSAYGMAQNGIQGIWLTQDKDSQIEIYQRGDRFYGKVVWLEKPDNSKGEPVTDLKNPDKSLRNRPIMGLDLLTEIVNKGEYWQGKLYGPKRGKTADVEIHMASEDQLKLQVSVMGFRRDIFWNRVQS